ncbi:MAG: HD domain-containing protein [Synergistaceae bacterium]|jgi:putative nucleotidyltransferase with HDIG domain|nr:HD domain-containing protein [Synergistaceae bacterium]
MDHFIHLLLELKRAGIEHAWLVGGVVRDFLLGREPSDVDVVCAGQDANAIAGKVGGAIVGKPPFCTVSTSLSGFPVEISLLTGPSIQKDLERRDFTINALAMDAQGRIIDPWGGESDIRCNVLRLVPAPTSPYEADPVRVVRLLRFACTLGFAVDDKTKEETKRFIQEHKTELASVPGERFGKEFLKGFAVHPYSFLTLLDNYSLLPTILPEIEAMRGVEQPVIFHPEGDVLQHTFRVVEEVQKTIAIRAEKKDIVLAFAALFHDIGKPQTARPHPKYEHTCFFGHDETGERMSLGLLNKWAVPGKIASQVASLVRCHMIPGGDFTERTGVKLLRKLGPELSEKLFDLALCDAKGAMGSGEKVISAQRLFRQIQSNLLRAGEASVRRLIDGNDIMKILGISPGRTVGRILEELDVAVGTGEVRGREEAIRWLKKTQTTLQGEENAGN